MSIPIPPIDLGPGGCSAIFGDTVYTYQANAFQSLPLTGTERKWSRLPLGVAVDRAKCVLGALEGKDALFIVGGISKDQGYSGLQRYTFADQKWQTMDNPTLDVRNRQMHGAAWLKDTNSILIYAGFRDGGLQNSSQTFTISTTAPFSTRAYISKAPPLINPIMMPWNASHVVMTGGSPTNQQIWTFSEVTGWQNVNVVLPSGLPDMTKVQASLIQASNGSKVLEIYDLTTSPNKVTALVLQPDEDLPPGSDLLPSIHTPATRSLLARDIDLTQWPRYDDTDAPKSTREGYSLAQSQAGLIIMTGGSDAADPICIFNQTGNSWINTKNFFNPSTTSTLTGSAPSPSDPTIGVVPADEGGGQASGGTSRTRIILGSVLGGIFGLAAICVLLLLLLRYRKSRRQRVSDVIANQGQSMEFDDRRNAAGRLTSLDEHGDSLKWNYATDGIAGPNSVGNAHTDTKRHLTTFPSVFANSEGATGTRRNSDEGYNAYSSAPRGQAMTQGAQGIDLSRDISNSRLTTYTEGSDYPLTDAGSRNHDSAEVPPLNIRSSAAPYHHEDRETFLGTNSSEQDSWDPLGATNGQSTYDRRPASSVYAESAHFPHPGQRVIISQFPGVPASARTSNTSPSVTYDRGLRTMASRDFGGFPGHQSDHSVAHGEALGRYKSASTEKGVSRGPESDMSWINLDGGHGR